MRHVCSALLSLVLLPCAVGFAAAQQNVCVHAADGAVVCGPVAQSQHRGSPSPFDQPGGAQPYNPYGNPAGGDVMRRPPPRRAVREAEHEARSPRHAYREPPPREYTRRPPPQRVAREEMRRQQAERDLPPPPRGAERDRPPRYSEADRRGSPHSRDMGPRPDDRDVAMLRRYDERLQELEREVRVMREQRDMTLRRDPYVVSQRGMRRPPREPYSDRD